MSLLFVISGLSITGKVTEIEVTYTRVRALNKEVVRTVKCQIAFEVREGSNVHLDNTQFIKMVLQ